MRKYNARRVLVRGEAVYYTTGRLLPEAPAFDPQALGAVTSVLQRCAAFSGVELYTFFVEPRGYSALLRVAPEQKRVTDEELLRRAGMIYSKKVNRYRDEMSPESIARTLEGGGAKARKLRRELTSRMADLSVFERTFRQRATLWYNRHHTEIGPMWCNPFTSVLVENHPAVRALVGAYIDLAPVRAGLASAPEHYPWCGFGAAASGSDAAMEALARMAGPDLTPAASLGRYRTLMQLWGPYPDPTPDALRAAADLPLPAEPALFARSHLTMENGGAIGRPAFIARQLKINGFRRRRTPPPGFTAPESPVRITHMRTPNPAHGRPRSLHRVVPPAYAANSTTH